MKCATVALVGRPSSGKSTLLNALCGAKVSIVSPHPQTTRNLIRGILTAEEGQLIFVDTPGFHDSERKMNRRLKGLLLDALKDVELLVYLIDATRRPGQEEQALAELAAGFRGRLLVAINKTDAEAADTAAARAFAAARLPSAAILEISALAGTGLDGLKQALYSAAPEGQAAYPAEYYTDQDPRFRAAEIIREKAMLQTQEEVPHSLFVEVADMEERREGELLWIRAFINVDRESQKGILVGTGGARIRAIRMAAQAELQTIFEREIYLDLRVKVSKDWRSKDHILGGLIS